jgi:hypothetical protein
MVTRDERLAMFNQGPAPPGQMPQILAEDHNGTYVVPCLPMVRRSRAQFKKQTIAHDKNSGMADRLPLSNLRADIFYRLPSLARRRGSV